ncbi:MAG: GIY-YIG nuclease family protein [Deltaproteobacteria bacterium]|jgi:DNA polymerase-3 subunit epsilon|nr:GIY-YIG nuclease family protein [Deltaproteobacteria bacterium]MBW2520750.1 GIY-YIG nuclease family protein [Deltaproteobacteria bacterium]
MHGKFIDILDKPIVFLDLETSGISPQKERIIEIGLCEHNNGRLDEWSALINPGKSIDPFIERLTGITNSMLAEAPTFQSIAQTLHERLSNKVIVAHNARFDCGFLSSEFYRLGMAFSVVSVCTVKLSRALTPHFRRHNLDALIERHGLSSENRHRALGDAKIVAEFFSKVIQEFPTSQLEAALQKQLSRPQLPPNLKKEQLDNLPHSPGVYLLYGERDVLLYVGKSINLRSRILSHFNGVRPNTKSRKLIQQVHHIKTIETAGELGALLMESRLIKEQSPIFNRRLRRHRALYSIVVKRNTDGNLSPQIVAMKRWPDAVQGQYFGTFRTKRHAEIYLRGIIEEQKLCNRLLGREGGSGACFNYQIKKCRGACVGKETTRQHDARLLNSLVCLKIRSWPFEKPIGIREHCPLQNRTDIHVFDQWCHLGTASDDTEFHKLLMQRDTLLFDLDSYKILTRFLDLNRGQVDLINLSDLDAINRLGA